MPQEYRPQNGRFQAYGDTTHYWRFTEIKQTLDSQNWQGVVGGPVFYSQGGGNPPCQSDSTPSVATLQHAVNVAWSYVIDQMQVGFSQGALSAGFGDAMVSFKYLLPQIWQQNTMPSFAYLPGQNAGTLQTALDAADPLSLYHWDAATQQVRANHPDKKNACQGLNQCTGLGWGGIATEKGNGACATADFHTCQGTNACKHQGGCGFLSAVNGANLPGSEQWIPGLNGCSNQGGCQTPISTRQKFNSASDVSAIQPVTSQARLTGLKGTSVWDQARSIFGTSSVPPLSTDRYNGNDRRTAVDPTSKS
ncbi:hypothetical protein [Acanthopleuribacter pedis]|uniref:Uncharacterized protein n=1 Tax=Acanthopleuribacter pedis TaxID=442870 RepID=A0A8J7U7V3_9BACT|nr:hypothetical protein [Acanthopleuribacter pedis]MBO1322918.1 hypothetical protein [Acanthopleuribacter pedis]